MTLTRGRFIGYEYDRMIVQFSMVDGQKEVSCAISTSAMDELGGIACASVGQREAQFMLLRERIEASPPANITRPSSKANHPG